MLALRTNDVAFGTGGQTSHHGSPGNIDTDPSGAPLRSDTFHGMMLSIIFEGRRYEYRKEVSASHSDLPDF
jgi:hypothetical protein